MNTTQNPKGANRNAHDTNVALTRQEAPTARIAIATNEATIRSSGKDYDEECLTQPLPSEKDKKVEDETQHPNVEKQQAHRILCRTMMAMDCFAFMVAVVSLCGLTVDDCSEFHWTRKGANSLGLSFWVVWLAVSMTLHFYSRSASLEWLLARVRYLSLVSLVLSIITGLFMAFGSIMSCGKGWVFLFLFYHIAGLFGVIASLVIWFGLPGRIRSAFQADTASNNCHLRPIRKWVVGTVSFATVAVPWSAIWLIIFMLVRADLNENLYPDPVHSPYKLPFHKGVKVFVVQGNLGKGTHNDPFNAYAYDFMAACGTPVVAARGGKIYTIRDDLTGNYLSGQPYNNYITIHHEDDDTFAQYYHIQQGSAAVNVGDSVAQGQEIARLGNVGNSKAPHLHFSIGDNAWGESTPMSFRDVSRDDGIPRSFRFYTAG